jgi:hypothetical protein
MNAPSETPEISGLTEPVLQHLFQSLQLWKSLDTAGVYPQLVFSGTKIRGMAVRLYSAVQFCITSFVTIKTKINNRNDNQNMYFNCNTCIICRLQ